ncbi:MAG: calcium-binding EGF-like domain-containing protein [Myxococcota bacterium]
MRVGVVGVVLFAVAACDRAGFAVSSEASGSDGVAGNSDVSEDTEVVADMDVDTANVLCPLGFELSANGCRDIDECGLNPCDTAAGCTNLAGSFNCDCPSGYLGNGFECADVDECLDSPCGIDATCRNEIGAFQCLCVPPLVGDGVTCTSCGNGNCEAGEGCESCEVDCGSCSSDCSGGACFVTKLRILDPISLAERGTLQDGAVLNRNTEFLSGFALFATVEPEVVGSVRFTIGSLPSVENLTPYARGPNTALDGALIGVEPFALGQGNYILTVSPFGLDDAGGEPGRGLTRTFSVVGDLHVPVGPQFGQDEGMAERNDAEELSSGAIVTRGPTIDIAGSNAAFFFTQFYLDPASPPASVSVQFSPSETSDTNSCTIDVLAAQIDRRIGVAPQDFDLSSRATGSARVTWQVPPFSLGTPVSTPDLWPLLEERIADATFKNRVLILFRPDGPISCSRRIISRDASVADQAKLVLSY